MRRKYITEYFFFFLKKKKKKKKKKKGGLVTLSDFNCVSCLFATQWLGEGHRTATGTLLGRGIMAGRRYGTHAGLRA